MLEVDLNMSELEYERRHKHPISAFPLSRRIIYVLSLATFLGLGILVYVACFVTAQPWNADFFYTFADVHIDDSYIAQSSKSSNCRILNESKVSRPYGRMGCYTPPALYESMIESMKSNAKRDPLFVLYGGDSVVWTLNESLERTTRTNKYVISKMRAAFPNSKFLFTLGNGDMYPDYSNSTMDPINFNSIAEYAKDFMSQEQIATFKKGGYYYHDFESKKLRMILANTIMYCSDYRDRVSDEDPYGQLEWLKTVIRDGRSKGFKVGLSVHAIPQKSYIKAGDNWFQNYIASFTKLLKNNPVDFIMGYHAHLSQLRVFNEGGPFAVAIVNPGLSTDHDQNPSYRSFTYKNGLIDMQQYYLQLRRIMDKAIWNLEYKFSDTFLTRDMSQNALLGLLKKMETNRELFDRYVKFTTSQESMTADINECFMKHQYSDDINKCFESLDYD